MILAYIAHRLGRGPDRDDNLAEAERWVEWAGRQGVVPIAPWVTLARFWDESRRAECMRLNGAALARCHEYWMCGESESPGMLEQRALAEFHRLRIRRFVERAELEPSFPRAGVLPAEPPCGPREGLERVLRGQCPWCDGIFQRLAHSEGALTWECPGGCNP